MNSGRSSVDRLCEWFLIELPTCVCSFALVCIFFFIALNVAVGIQTEGCQEIEEMVREYHDRHKRWGFLLIAFCCG